MDPINVLITDKNFQLSRRLDIGLRGYGYRVTTVSTGEEILATVAQQAPDIILLNLDLAVALEGITLCRRLREWSRAPVIMLSDLDVQRLKVQALDVGADDYVVEPFGLAELEARIRAIVRRTAEQKGSTEAYIRIKDLQIDPRKRRVWVQGTEIHLTPKEYEMLCLFARNPGKIFTHCMLVQEVWGDSESHDVHYARIFVNAIRKKLHEDRTDPYIISHPGIGYQFVDVTG